ncbi:hypothetical protein Micbo1qcDRAFT_113696 [Microdochium bolleyi]|uniref:Uncharacterized protein n=1 Tax=Microdochium bolleyi TaxID=196109 RepID=A0A136JH92_9PEZI|nr:hypothetical protein Micbo1qcDRAFT_113696 [Microdochium bolleyi]
MADRRGETRGQRPGVCFQFQKGKCKFGTRCKFSHDTSVNTGGTFRPAAKVPAASRQAQGDLHRFRDLLRRAPSSTGRLASGVGVAFFQTARKLLDGDLGAAQETVKLLSQDEGLNFIRHLVKDVVPNARTPSSQTGLWQDEVKPLFETVTHERIVESAVLEQHLAAIYNFMIGINGERVRCLFDLITALLPTSNLNQQVDITRLSLAVLHKLVDCNTNNIVAGVLDPIVRVFAATVPSMKDVSDHDKLHISHHLQYISRRLGIGAALPVLGSQKHSVVEKPTFQLAQDLPGRLSKTGPRHDNDHADIANIKILPTYDEIMSVRAEYLPTNDASLFHKPGIEGRIDREFRLLREDTVGQLRDAVRRKLDTMHKPQTNHGHGAKDNTLRTFVYTDASVEDLQVERSQGLSILVNFAQCAPGKERKSRQDWWEHSRRLQPGGLVCVVSSKATAFFAVVSEKPKSQSSHKENLPIKDDLSLFGDPDHAYVCLNLADESRDSLRHLLRWTSRSQAIVNRTQWFLVEFPGILLPSFRFTLEALQSLSKKPDMPFTEIIAPSRTEGGDTGLDSEGFTHVQPPLYATKPGFSCDLACLTDANTPLMTSIRKPLDPKQLAEVSPLDSTQSSALLSALNRSMALIQGPPGTGKSYTGEKLIKVLLANKKKAKLGPILCVCYTNHALDQLLEHLLDSGVERIIRMGSRSKSERLEKLNLRVVEKGEERTKAEKSALYNIYGELDAEAKSANRNIAQLKACDSLSALEQHLALYHAEHHTRLFGNQIDTEGFQTVEHDRTSRLSRWMKGGTATVGPPRPVDELRRASLDTMSTRERQRLIHHWDQEMRNPAVTQIVEAYMRFVAKSRERTKTTRDVDLRCLGQADIIGITTTGLARNISLLQRLRSKVVLCEEAGEVLEAHTITALLPSIEHAILIGDHLQLPPQTQNYELQSTHPRGARYALDVSLFERLVQPPFDDDPKLPYCTLETQRRMHPSVSELIRATLYPNLVDGGAVAEYPEVFGMRKRLFWFDHAEQEEQGPKEKALATTSRTNQFEIEMTIKLVQHLVRQGEYGPEDIAVITPYLGQLQRMRRQMSTIFEVTVGDRDLEDLTALDADQPAADAEPGPNPMSSISKTTVLKSIRLATVDNFQGEEAKVVIISLVRSNPEKKCGFLKTPNRINVLLSRAKHGMYIIGDSATYGHVPMWSEVLDILRDGGNLGESLGLCCPRHPATEISVSKPDHFLQFAPEGGCQLPCDRRLGCGHACVTRCHSAVLHNAVKCLEPCPRPRKDCPHPCVARCGDPCPAQCKVRLRDKVLELPCGHDFRAPQCWQTRDVQSILCDVAVERKVPGCGHEIKVPCHVDVDSVLYQCRETCGAVLSCGHTCKKSCFSCRPRAASNGPDPDHGECLQPCHRDIKTCRHRCTIKCHGAEPCPPCAAPCDVRCSHSRCDRKCWEPCPPCAEQRCASRCPHSSCTMPCAAPCDWIPCTKRCTANLPCGHQCPSICGEACPPSRFCQTCGDDSVRHTAVDFIEGLQYYEIQLDDDPCIFPDCGHFITCSSMDGVMSMSDHYQLGSDGNPIQLGNHSKPFSMGEVKVCPICRGSLRNISRYGRIVRRALLDESTKKFILWSNGRCAELGQKIIDNVIKLSQLAKPAKLAPTTGLAAEALAKLPKSRLSQLDKMNKLVGSNRYKNLLRLFREVQEFSRRVKIEEQPFCKVADLVRFASKSKTLQFDESVLQVKGTLMAISLRLKCELAVVLDFLGLRKDIANLRPYRVSDFSSQLQDCTILINLATDRDYPRECLEGHLFYAKFCIVSRGYSLDDTDAIGATTDAERKNHATEMTREAEQHIQQAESLLEKYASLSALKSEVDAASLMLTSGTFYSDVSEAELRAVYTAMAGELRGTGHWYRCVNGHPFTVGECGMPMQLARCPECGEGVGGSNHEPTQGVERATEMDDLARGLGGMHV